MKATTPTATRHCAAMSWWRHPGIALCVGLIHVLSPARAKGTIVYVENRSVLTSCAEHDNVNIPLHANVAAFTIQATHPTYDVTTYACPKDFTNCPPMGHEDFPFEPAEVSLYDDGVWVVWAYREERFWRPQGMLAKVGDSTLTDAHRIAVTKKITGEDSWPQFLVLYCDGNLRLIPHPPEGQSEVCFGASIIVGPAEPADRPLAEIESLEFDSVDKSLLITYRAGGSSRLALAVDRTTATVNVQVDYASDQFPFATFRSMYVSLDNCDTADVTTWRQHGLSETFNVLETIDTCADWVSFTRTVPSQHTMSAPDFTITVGRVGLHRFWSPLLSRHFYTMSECEKRKLLEQYAHVWTYEGTAYYGLPEQSDPDAAPVYRFWSPVLSAHFYTICDDEKDKLLNKYPDVWTYEGVGFFAYPSGRAPAETTPVHRFWSDVLSCHFYTMSEAERDWLVDNYAHVWTYEDIAWWAYEK